ncbi:hypothetical protein LBMAG49_04460 [Planctomycetota bacterium]|jgi:hypothetical protein|nr:hypothetical protein LBMAG49_04460 [Planctomycetota bacterium]
MQRPFAAQGLSVGLAESRLPIHGIESVDKGMGSTAQQLPDTDLLAKFYTS